MKFDCFLKTECRNDLHLYMLLQCGLIDCVYFTIINIINLNFYDIGFNDIKKMSLIYIFSVIIIGFLKVKGRVVVPLGTGGRSLAEILFFVPCLGLDFILLYSARSHSSLEASGFRNHHP